MLLLMGSRVEPYYARKNEELVLSRVLKASPFLNALANFNLFPSLLSQPFFEPLTGKFFAFTIRVFLTFIFFITPVCISQTVLLLTSSLIVLPQIILRSILISIVYNFLLCFFYKPKHSTHNIMHCSHYLYPCFLLSSVTRLLSIYLHITNCLNTYAIS